MTTLLLILGWIGFVLLCLVGLFLGLTGLLWVGITIGWGWGWWNRSGN